MIKYPALFLAITVLAPATAPCAALAKEGARKAPNLIVIMTYDQGYGDTRFNGCKDIPTTKVDHLAASGATGTSAYATNQAWNTRLI